MRKIIATMAILLAAGGCAGVEKNATYDSAASLKDAAVRAGYDCPDWTDADTAPDKFDSGNCLSDNRDQFFVYPSKENREENLEGIILGTQMVMTTGRVEMALLVGPNWMIRGPVNEVKALEGTLGGFLPDLSDVRMPQ